MKPWQKWLLAALLIIVAVETYLLLRPDPKDKTIQQLQSSKTAVLKQNDSVNKANAIVIKADSLLNIRYWKDTTRLNKVVDSLQARQNDGELRLAKIKIQLKQTVDNLSEAVSNTADTASINQLVSLRDQLNSASDIVDFLRSNNIAKDSVMANAIEFRDSTIAFKNSTIAAQEKVIEMLQAQINKLSADLDTAIAALKKGKKKNILRTVAEAAGVVGLILLLK